MLHMALALRDKQVIPGKAGAWVTKSHLISRELQSCAQHTWCSSHLHKVPLLNGCQVNEQVMRHCQLKLPHVPLAGCQHDSS